MQGKASASHLHVHDVAVGRHQAIAHLQPHLKCHAGFLHVHHHIVELDVRLSCLEGHGFGIGRLLQTIDSLNREIGEFTNEKTQKGKRIEELSRKLNVSEKNKKKDAVITRNINNLKDFITKFKAKKKESLEEQILKGLETLMHKKGFIKKYEITFKLQRVFFYLL